MVQALNQLRESPSQTAGPYVHIGCTPNFCDIHGVYPTDLGVTMVSPGVKGEPIIVTGRVIDGGGFPLRDALVEIWQADAAGLYNSPQERRGKADAVVLVHGLDHVVDQLLKLPGLDPVGRHRAGHGAERRKAETGNFQNHRVTSLRGIVKKRD